MSVLSAQGDDAGNAGGTEPRWRRAVRRPYVVLVLGLIAMAVVLLLLFWPFYLFGFPPGQVLVWGILDGPGSLLPSRFQWWLGDHSFFALLILSGLVLVVVPWYVANVRQRAERRLRSAGSASASGFSASAGISREERTTSVVSTEDGRVERAVGAADAAARYSVTDLRSMARASGIPWKSAYETAGGARAVLEILGAVHADSSASASASSTPAPAPGSSTDDHAAPSGAPVDGSATWRESAPTGAGDDSGSAAADGFTPSSTSAPFSVSTGSTPSWTSGFTSSGSVYTSTSLYDSERAERSVLGTDPEDHADAAEGEVENR